MKLYFIKISGLIYTKINPFKYLRQILMKKIAYISLIIISTIKPPVVGTNTITIYIIKAYINYIEFSYL